MQGLAQALPRDHPLCSGTLPRFCGLTSPPTPATLTAGVGSPSSALFQRPSATDKPWELRRLEMFPGKRSVQRSGGEETDGFGFGGGNGEGQLALRQGDPAQETVLSPLQPVPPPSPPPAAHRARYQGRGQPHAGTRRWSQRSVPARLGVTPSLCVNGGLFVSRGMRGQVRPPRATPATPRMTRPGVGVG